MGYDVRDENSYRGDIAIEYTGLRPGEKLFEELLIGESVTGTEHPKIMRAEEDYLPWETLEPMLKELQVACSNMDLQSIRSILMRAVVGFEPETLADDPLWLQYAAAKRSEAATVRAASASASAKVTPLHKR
jgi:FlaA1/EpsC-like NDP-sugar epimerase